MSNQIIHSDCLKGMKQLPSDYVDLTVTSPPYDELRTYDGYSFDFENIAKELYRVTKSGGVVVWVVADATRKGSETGTSFRQALHFIDIGFNLHDTMIFLKENALPRQNNRYEQHFEYMFVLSKGKPKTTNLKRIPSKKAGVGAKRTARDHDKDDITKRYNIVADTKLAGNVWSYHVGMNMSTKDVEAFEHPAIFPEQLALDHILSWTNPGELVMDIFAGSGTTAKMALLHERNFIGFEISEKYVQIARRRIENVQPAMIF